MTSNKWQEGCLVVPSGDEKGNFKTEKLQLKGWNEIADFLGQTVSVAQRWQKSGMLKGLQRMR